MWTKEEIVGAMLLFAFGVVVSIVFSGWHP